MIILNKRSFFSAIAFCIFLIFIYSYRNEIVKFAITKSMQYETLTLPDSNNYKEDFNFGFVKKTDDFHIKNYQGMLDSIYSVLDNGTSEFSFYCDESYQKCLDDFEALSHNQVLLSTINNMVSPYNSYEKINFKYNSYGKITVIVDKLYSTDEINSIEDIINKFISENIKEDMDATQKVKAFHDYLINNSVYDKSRADAIENGTDNSNSNSHKATGPLINGISLCSGYSDAMKIYLDKLKIANYKISNSNHIWNLVNINNKWLHLDLTWDDPVTNTGENLLLYKFFLIDTDTLLQLDPKGHNFDRNYYLEISH